MKNKWILVGLILVFCLLAGTVGSSQAQGTEPPEEGSANTSESEIQTAVGSRIPVQGKLVDSGGNPVPDGNYSITASLYNVDNGGTALCADTQIVAVTKGLFTMNVRNCTPNVINGQQLWLGIKVGSEAEMSPRQPIYPVPYAWSLKPGARIIENNSSILLYVQNNGSGPGVYGYSLSGEGLYGWSEDGSGVYGHSTNGISLMADGTGIIKSTAATDWNVSPLNIVPGDTTGDGDLKIVHSTSFGFVALYSTGADNCTALLPVDVAAYLFGTRVKFSEFHFCYSMADTSLDDTITQVDVEYTNVSGGRQNLCSFTTDVSSTSWTCATCTAASPVDIYGPLFARFTLHFEGDGYNHRIRLGHMYAKLVE